MCHIAKVLGQLNELKLQKKHGGADMKNVSGKLLDAYVCGGYSLVSFERKERKKKLKVLDFGVERGKVEEKKVKVRGAKERTLGCEK